VSVSPRLFACSQGMREVAAKVSRAAATRAGVVICGEHGTGRETVARAIHAHGGPGAPLVAIDCAALEPSGVEVVLFGCASAPAGDAAEGERRVLEPIARWSGIALANGGTLLLRHVMEMPERTQARIARLLRDREATLVETGAATEVNVRPIAVVDAGIESAVTEGRLRGDLSRRLDGIRIEVPPLRERREDIPELAAFFVEEICAASRLAPKALTDSARTLLSALPWRGNAHEMRGLLESLVLVVQGQTIRLEDVLARVRLDGGPALPHIGGTLRQARQRFESEYILAVLGQHHGRMGEAARTLGIQRTNLYRKMRELHLPRRPSGNGDPGLAGGVRRAKR